MKGGAVYPTRAAALLAAAGVPVALVAGVVAPGRWYAALAWPAGVLAATLLDALLGPRQGEADLALPATAPVGATVPAAVTVRLAGAARGVEVAIAADPRLAVPDDGRAAVALRDGRGAATLPLTTLRRGTAEVATLWLRWRGALGLVWHQRERRVARAMAVLPDLRPVEERGARLFRRHALHGLIAQLDRGEGTEFDTLAEWRPGMDRRSIDWKQSARHRRLHAKQYRPERNAQLVLALDAGRAMADPLAGVPRVDRAVSAALLAAWVALKLGDRVALAAFDDRPRLHTGFVAGTRAFATLQRRAAAIDYGSAEANYTGALADLAGRLTRRSTVMLFTEVTGPAAAGFLVRAAERLAAAHLLLVVVLRDAELEAIVARPPTAPADVTRAVTAAGLLRDRALVLGRLRQLGAQVVDADHDRLGDALVAAYVDLKRRGLA